MRTRDGRRTGARRGLTLIEVVIALICFAHERGRRSGMGWFVQTLRRATKRWGL